MTMTMPTAPGAPTAAVPARAGASAKDSPAAGSGFAAALTAADAAAPAAGRVPARDTDGREVSTGAAESGAAADAPATQPTQGQTASMQPAPTQPAPADAGALAALLGLPVAAASTAPTVPGAPPTAPAPDAPSLAADAPSLAVGDGSLAPEAESGRAARVSAEALAGAAQPVSGRASQPSLTEGDAPRVAQGENGRAARVSPTGAAVGAAAAGTAPTGTASAVAGGLPASPTTGAPSLAVSDSLRAPQAENGRAARVSPATAEPAGPAAAPAAPTAPAAAATAPQHGADAIVRTQGEPSLQAGPTGRTPDATLAVPSPTTTAPTSTTATSATQPAAPAATPTPLTQQLARPVFSLAQAAPGEHVVTVQVVPDTLGPVTVRAHVTAHGMHVELFAASDAGREAVRQVLPDLRREGSAVATTLDLSSQNHPGQSADQSAARDGRPTGGPAGQQPDREARPATAEHARPATTTVRTAGLDVLA